MIFLGFVVLLAGFMYGWLVGDDESPVAAAADTIEDAVDDDKVVH